MEKFIFQNLSIIPKLREDTANVRIISQLLARDAVLVGIAMKFTDNILHKAVGKFAQVLCKCLKVFDLKSSLAYRYMYSACVILELESSLNLDDSFLQDTVRKETFLKCFSKVLKFDVFHLAKTKKCVATLLKSNVNSNSNLNSNVNSKDDKYQVEISLSVKKTIRRLKHGRTNRNDGRNFEQPFQQSSMIIEEIP